MNHSRNHSKTTKGRRGRRTLIIILTTVALLLAGIAGALMILGKKVGNAFDSGATQMAQSEVFPDEASRPKPQDGMQTILLLGSDTRDSIDTNKIDAGQDGRSDTIMLVRIPRDRSKVFVTSIMRDSWVNIEGYGDAKINAAMAYGGVPLTVRTIETLMDTRIDHVALIDFEGFKALTDAIGGVHLNNPIEITPLHGDGVTIPSGPVDLNGEEALAFVRERYGYVDGDYQRAKNQQLYLKAVFSKLISGDTVRNPGVILDTVTAISPYIAVDEGLSSGYVAGLLPSLAGIRTDDIVTFTLPTSGVGTSPDGQSIVLLDETRMQELRKAFSTDTLGDYVARHYGDAY